jgi:hypothetical protein
VGGKVRVHELAKEFGITSREILARLKADGENVKSASSTLEAPAARRLREALRAMPPQQPTAAPRATQRRAVGTTPSQPKAAASTPARQSSRLTSADALDIYRRHRLASISENPDLAVDEVLRDCQSKYGVSRSALRQLVTSDKLRRRFANDERRVSAAISAPRKPRNNKPSPGKQARPPKPRSSNQAATAQSTTKPPSGGESTRPRPRTTHLPQPAATMDVEAVTNIVDAKTSSAYKREAIFACLDELAPRGSDAYGYLIWRYSATRTARSESSLSSAHQDLVALAIVIEHDRQLLDSLIRAHGSILTKPALAETALDKEFGRFISAHGRARTASDELLRARDSFEFLRRAVVLTIAASDNGQRLWNMIGPIKPPKSDDHAKISPQLERARRRLTDFIATVERLLSTDEANLAQFFGHSRAHLIKLQLKKYDFLRQFRDSAAGLFTVSGHLTTNLAFQILPQGEQLRTFLGDIRKSKTYSGYRVDEHRLTVLENLQKYFGAARCTWHMGIDTGGGIGSRYLVLAIKSSNGSGENAVAISPLAGRHATYVVRRECAEADWDVLFAHPKFEARLRGARKLLFTNRADHTDPYNAMCDRIIKLLECHPREFRKWTDNERKSRTTRTGDGKQGTISSREPVKRRKVKYQLLLDSVQETIRQHKIAGMPNDLNAEKIWKSLDAEQQETLLSDLRTTEHGHGSDPLEMLHRFVRAQRVPRPSKNQRR